MDWRLIDYAEEAEDAARKLSSFKDEIPQYAKDLTANIAELYAISNALRVLDEGLDLSRFGRWSGRILMHLDVLLPSLGHTFDAIRGMFNKKKEKQHPGAFPGTPPYDLLWEDACADLEAEGIGLPRRLESYRVYLQGLYDILRGEPSDDDLDRIRIKLIRLLKKQEPVVRVPEVHKVGSYFGNLNLGDPRPYVPGGRTPRPKSPVRHRPKMPKYPTFPVEYAHVPAPSNYQHPPPPPPPLHLPHMYSHPGVSVVYGDVPLVPPPVPEAPHSPTYSTASSQTFSTHSNDSSGPVPHWAMKVFDGRHPSTPFQILGQQTKCLGRDEPHALEMLEKDGFIKVAEMPFEATNVWVRLYWRADDSRARILFLSLNADGRRMRYCFPLTGLKILRTESCLQLCRVNRHDGQLDLWANLRFLLYERMVLFYCTLVAMKRQDEVPTAPGLEDVFQPGEKEEYGGEIKDNNTLRAFRIFRDRDSGGVRFEVRARHGSHKNVPIWTAFVTKYIGSRGWMKRVGGSTVQFKELHPYVFCDGYRPPQGPSGKYQLTFTTYEDAIGFMDMFHRIKKK